MATVFLYVNRTTTLGGNLQVGIQVSGTAVVGTDYSFVSGFDSFSSGTLLVTIPTGQLSQIVVINTLISPATSKNAIFTVIDGASVLGVFPKTQTLTINPNPVGDYLDFLTISPIIAYGLRRLRSSYTGSPCRVRNLTTNAETDLPFASTGLVDVAAALTFANGASLAVTIWYNQGSLGSIGDALPRSGLFTNFLVTNGVMQFFNGVPVINQKGNGFVIPTTNPSALGSGVLQSLFLCYAGGMDGTRFGKMVVSNSLTLGYGTNFANQTRVGRFFSGGTTNGVNVAANDSVMRIYTARSPVDLSQNAEFYENGVQYTGDGGTTTSPTNDIFTNQLVSGAGDYSHSNMGEFVLFKSRLQPSEKDIVENSLISYFGA
jgi:hypothetical protein